MYHRDMSEIQAEVQESFSKLVAGCRDQCLWFLRRDYCPTEPDEMRRVLEYIRRHGDREAFRTASRITKWLSPSSSERSAGS